MALTSQKIWTVQIYELYNWQEVNIKIDKNMAEIFEFRFAIKYT